ncbi:MAG TPA: DegQ family serine endoprotease, partial [Chromatiaceae bacterium]|nr:DegQ family serine endoprotease [Chromatiaceae bacterium]
MGKLFKQITLFLSCLIMGLGGAMAGSLPDFTRLVEENAPAVVNISTVSHGRQSYHQFHKPENMPIPENSPFNDLFRRFFDEEGRGEMPPEESESLGSGFIISTDGYVLTNHHVVDGADEVIVRLSNRKSYEAKVVGSDEASDIALLKIDAEDLPAVRIGNSKNLKIGAWVLAIGSPFGFDATVTAGIVSAKGRSLPSENYVPYIQTDVAINPGNSGGPLFNLDGEVVGVNSQIFSRSGGFMGLSFAVPIELAMNVVEQLRRNGRVTRGYLGVLIQDVDRNLAETFGMNRPQGALVARVIKDSPAAKGGLQVGDVILAFNQQPLSNSSQLPPLVGTMPIGEDARLKVLRNGKEIDLTVRISELPSEEAQDQPEKSSAPEAARSNKLGLVFSELTADERKRLELSDDEGVLVREVHEGPAATAGVDPGDVVLMVDGKKISSLSQLQQIISEVPNGK